MRRFLAILAAMFAMLAIEQAVPAKSAPPVSADRNIAILGHDPVAFFVDGKPKEGREEHTIVYEGAVWRFASAENLSKFRAHPARYAPQFGGYCAWAVSQHYLAPGDPRFWKIVDGKLYLNANARAKELWEEDQAEAIRRGHRNWPAVLSDNQDSGTSQ